MSSHTKHHFEESLQRDIERIKNKVIEMSNRAEEALEMSLKALTDRDRQMAYAVILRDQYIDELELEVDTLCLEFIVRQQPVAGHLRFVFATIQIIKELERIGDYAEGIARHVLSVLSIVPLPQLEKLTRLANLSIPMMHNAMQAYLKGSVDLARVTMDVETKADQLRDEINDDLSTLRKEGKLPFSAFSPLSAITRRLERVSDKAQNICEEVLYMTTGEYAKHKGSDIFKILFVDGDNSCLSQMAEGIANSLCLPKFLFLSAGIEKQPLDPRTVSFMAGKGIDISKHSSKTLKDIQELEYMQVMVGLSQDARAVIPPVSAVKTIGFDWRLDDPRLCVGPEKEIQAAYESAFNSIRGRIQELVQAILGEG